MPVCKDILHIAETHIRCQNRILLPYLVIVEQTPHILTYMYTHLKFLQEEPPKRIKEDGL